MSATELVLRVNGERIVVRDPDPDSTLIEFLRSRRLTGAKLVCGEGACGACTVALTRYDPRRRRPVTVAVNSCLFPLCAADGCGVTTVEGLGSAAKNRIHGIQRAIAEKHGSQCGFCTPGFVMAIFAFLSENPKAGPASLESCLDGNLCRCTGHRPILDAAKKVSCLQIEDLDAGTLAYSGERTRFDEAEARSRPELVLGERWFAPRGLPEMARIKARFPEARIIAGNSEVGVDMRLKGLRPTQYIYAVNVPELNCLEVASDGVVVGGAVSLTDLGEFLEAEVVGKMPRERTGAVRAILKQLRVFACRQVRNTACVAGNLTTASPTSDLNPVLLACNARVTLHSAARGSEVVAVDSEWFTGYRKVRVAPDQIVVSVMIPFTRPGEYVEAYKVSRRKEDDIHVSAACFRVVLAPEPRGVSVEQPTSGSSSLLKPFPLVKGGLLTVQSFSAAFGSMAVKTSLSPSASQFLCGKLWSSSLLPGVCSAIEKDLPLGPKTPGGVVDFRRTMTRSLFFKFLLKVCHDAYGESSVPREYLSAIAEDAPHHEPTKSSQKFEPVSTSEGHTGEPLQHLSAEKHATGEAMFVDDFPVPSGGLHAALVISSKAHAKIKSVDFSKAKSVPGFVAAFGHKDVPGKNAVGESPQPDEELFASEVVHCVGQQIAVVVADSHAAARRAASAVSVEYEELKPILSIKEAIDAKSFLSPTFSIERGEDLEKVFCRQDLTILEGEVVVGGQDHFYLEPQACTAVPGEAGEMDILSSTQNPTMTQACVAKVLGVPDAAVTSHVRRVGGGFGGKETRTAPTSCAAAVAARITGRPVRLVLDRDVDMQVHGTRHPFMGRYKIALTKEGKVEGYDVELFSNGGHCLDLSIPVLHRALFHVDNSYYVPNLRCRGTVCRTNRPSNTAFRGFGGPQGMIVIETALARAAVVLGVEPAKIREINLYREGQTTHYQKKVECCQLQRVWSELLGGCRYEDRRREARAFNEQNRWRKRGVYAVPVKFGLSFTHAPLNQAGSLVHVYRDGSVSVSHGACEIGQGVSTKMAQIAAQELRIPVSQVRVMETSTATVANTSATAASVQADLNGMAVLDACRQIRTRLDAFIASGGASAHDTWPELLEKAYNQRVDLSAHGFYSAEFGYDWKTHQGKVFAYFTYGAACSEVELDVLTGEHRVLRSDVVVDLGRSLNPAIDVGQVEGAFVQGLGWCTTEEILVFDGSGQLYTRGPGTYKVPGAGDVPKEFNVSLLSESKNPFAVHSSKGVGEPPFFLGTSVFFALKEAVASARSDAGISGFHQITLPASCDRLRMACRDPLTDMFGAPPSLPGCFVDEYPTTRDDVIPL